MICIVLQGFIFNKVLGNHVRKFNKIRIGHLKNLKLFAEWDRPALYSLLTYMYVRNPSINQYVYRKGDTNENIYIVISGELDLVIDFDYEKEREENRDHQDEPVEEKFRNKYFLPNKVKQNEEISLFRFTEGNYFGDEEGFMPPTKKYSVKARSNNVKLYLIPKDVNFSKIQQKSHLKLNDDPNPYHPPQDSYFSI